MSAAAKRKRSDPLATILFDLENLHEDLEIFLPVSWINKFDGTVTRFISIIRDVKSGLKKGRP